MLGKRVSGGVLVASPGLGRSYSRVSKHHFRDARRSQVWAQRLPRWRVSQVVAIRNRVARCIERNRPVTTTYTAAPGTGQLLGYARVSTGHQSLDQQSDALHAPPGDFCHGLLHPDLMGPNRTRAERLPRPSDRHRWAVSRRRRLPRRPRHHLHPRIQRGLSGARRHRLTYPPSMGGRLRRTDAVSNRSQLLAEPFNETSHSGMM
jgi:hypothetical protein